MLLMLIIYSANFMLAITARGVAHIINIDTLKWMEVYFTTI